MLGHNQSKNYAPISFLMDRKTKWTEHLAVYEQVIGGDRDAGRSKKKCVCVCVCLR